MPKPHKDFRVNRTIVEGMPFTMSPEAMERIRAVAFAEGVPTREVAAALATDLLPVLDGMVGEWLDRRVQGRS